MSSYVIETGELSLNLRGLMLSVFQCPWNFKKASKQLYPTYGVL